jgi:hypothetical protein
MGGSNSSQIQQDSVTNITTEYNAVAVVQQNTTCTISGTEIVSVGCNVKFQNTCYSGTNVSIDNVISVSADTTTAAITDQSAQNGMFRFLNFNSASTSQSIQTYMNTNVGTSCSITNNVNAVIQNTRIYLTKRPCIRSIQIYNLGTTSSNCALKTTLNLFSNAELNATTTQQSGGLGGSSGDGNCISVLLVLVVVSLFLAVGVLFTFRILKKRKADW